MDKKILQIKVENRTRKTICKMCKKKLSAVISSVMAAVMIMTVAVIPVSAASASGPDKILLSYTNDTSTSVSVTWHDASASVASVPESGAYNNAANISGAYVTYSKAASMSGALVRVAALDEPESGIPLSENIYSAELTGLTPDTLYYYTVTSGVKAGDSASKKAEHTSSVKSFTTSSAADDGVSFIYMGDVQVVSDAASEYAAWGKMIQQAYRNNPDLNFGLMGGDIVESGISASQFDLFLENAEPVFSKLPLMEVNGNHESNFVETGKPELYLDEFTLPQNGPEGYKEEFYSFDYENCHVTALNSWVYSGEQKVSDADYKRIKDWIRNDLKSTDADFKIIVMHHPVYALENDTVSDDIKAEWAPIFEECGVDLVLCGHQHVYARSYPMKAGKIDYQNGITYVMGMSGEKFYSAADETWQEKTVYDTSNYQVIRINGNELTLESCDADGNVLDYWITSARGSASAQVNGNNQAQNGSAGDSDSAQVTKKPTISVFLKIIGKVYNEYFNK